MPRLALLLGDPALSLLADHAEAAPDARVQPAVEGGAHVARGPAGGGAHAGPDAHAHAQAGRARVRDRRHRRRRRDLGAAPDGLLRPVPHAPPRGAAADDWGHQRERAWRTNSRWGIKSNCC